MKQVLNGVTFERVWDAARGYHQTYINGVYHDETTFDDELRKAKLALLDAGQNSTLTLDEWASKQEIEIHRHNDRWYSIPDSLNLVDRSQAFRLKDFGVSHVAGGSIHFTARGVKR